MYKTWTDAGIDDSLFRKDGENKLPCPKQCSKNPGKKDLSVNSETGLFECKNPGCGFKGRVSADGTPAVRSSEYRQVDVERYKAASKGITKEVELWFSDRGISRKTIEACNVDASACLNDTKTGVRIDAIRFPYERAGDLVNVKMRAPLDKQNMRMMPGSELILWRLDHAAETTIIAEGEPDAMAYVEAGFDNVLSVPNGAPSSDDPEKLRMEYLANSAPSLEHVQRYILSSDRDHPGKVLRDEMARRLKIEHCSYVDYDLVCDGSGEEKTCKDANDILLRHGADALKILIDQPKPYPYDGIVRPSDLIDTVMDWYDHGMPVGQSTGFANVDEYWRVLEGEMTIISGVPGHGKSEYVDSLLLNLYTLHGWRSTIFSPESYPEASHHAKILEKVIGKPFDEDSVRRWARLGFRSERMTRAEVIEGSRKIDQFLSFVSPGDESYSLDEILERVRAEVFRRGIKVAVIDPFNEVEHTMDKGMSETQYISYALSKIRRFARHNGIHFFIVAHPTKLTPTTEKYEDEDGNTRVRSIYPPPTLYHINGCYSEDTEVLTANGWKMHADVTTSDRVACFDPSNGKIRYLEPSQTWSYDYDGPMHHLRGKTFECLVTPNHRMVVKQTWRDKKPMKGTGMGRPMKYLDGWTFIEAQNLASSLKVPLAATRSDDRPDLETILDMPANDVLRYIGWWVSEGSLQLKAPTICQAVGPMAEKMEATIARLGMPYTSHTYDPSNLPGKSHEQVMWMSRFHRRASPEFCDWIPEQCGIGCANKRLPGLTWSLSLRQQRVLFEALVDGDGSRYPNGSMRYHTTSKQLADEVQRLAIELGHPAMITMYDRSKDDWLDKYEVNIGRPERTAMCLRMDRHQRIEQYSGKVYCLTVPTGAYITRRNGRMMIAGNSAAWKNKADNGIIVWRDAMAEAHGANPHLSTVIVEKVKKKYVGRTGTVQLLWHPPSGRYRVPTDADMAGGGRPSSAVPKIEAPTEVYDNEMDTVDF